MSAGSGPTRRRGIVAARNAPPLAVAPPAPPAKPQPRPLKGKKLKLPAQ
jgi:hypothetical protein